MTCLPCLPDVFWSFSWPFSCLAELGARQQKENGVNTAQVDLAAKDVFSPGGSFSGAVSLQSRATFSGAVSLQSRATSQATPSLVQFYSFIASAAYVQQGRAGASRGSHSWDSGRHVNAIFAHVCVVFRQIEAFTSYLFNIDLAQDS